MTNLNSYIIGAHKELFCMEVALNQMTNPDDCDIDTDIVSGTKMECR